jgi:Zn-dependent peptidase ImmA (M78 family)
MNHARKSIAPAKARELLKELNILEPDEIEIELIAAFKNAPVRYEPLNGMDGRIVREGNAAIITVNSAITYEGQKRFVIAHELGHFFLHPNTRQIESVNQEQTNNWSERQDTEEYEANIFAAELLMPSAMISKRIKGKIPSFELIDSLQKDFRTTLTATAVQYVLNTNEECAIVSSSKRQRLWFLTSKGFSFRMQDDSYIHGLTCAAKVGPNKKNERCEQIEAYYWLEGFKGLHKSYITEDARYFPALDRSLSLIWIHKII